MLLTLRSFAAYWRRAPAQLFFVIAGLAIATALWAAVQAINSEARSSYAQAMRIMGGGDLVALTATDDTLTRADFVALRRAGWQVTPVMEDRLHLPSGAITLLGIDMLSHPFTSVADRSAGAGDLTQLEILYGAPRVFAGPELSEELNALGFEVIPAKNLPAGMALADISLVSARLGPNAPLSRILVLGEQPPGPPPIKSILPNLNARQQAQGALGDPERLTRSFHLNLTAFGLLSFAVGLFIVQGTVSLSIEQRQGTIRTLRCLGVSLATLTSALLVEILSLSLIAGLLGIALGYVIAGALLPDVSATLGGLYGAPVDNTLFLRPEWILSGLGMAVLGGGLAGGQAVYRLRRTAQTIASTQAIRRPSPKGLLRLALTGCALILLGLLVFRSFEGLTVSFILLGGVMIGAALTLPYVVFCALHLLSMITRHPQWRWLVADSEMQLPGLSLALMALLLAIATNIGVATMVSSFRLTFIGWIDQRLAADVYVRVLDRDEAEKLMTWATDQGLRSLPQLRAEARSASGPVLLYGLRDDPLYREYWPMISSIEAPWDHLHQSGGVLINEQLSYREGLSPGDDLRLETGERLPIVGIYSDYGNSEGQAIMAEGTLRALYPDYDIQRVGLAGLQKSVEETVEALNEGLDIAPEDIIRRDDIRRSSLQVFDRTFVVTAALNVLTLGVAGFALLTSFLSQWNRRLPQLAPIWAMGLTRLRLAGLEVARSVGFALLTFVLALPLGLLLAWVLLTVVNVEAFGWRLPMHVFPQQWLWVLLWTCLMAIVSAVVPALRLLREPPARILGVFANDR